jgi:Short C-terminal domain
MLAAAQKAPVRDMAVSERKTTRAEAPQAALTACAQALAKAGFNNIQTHPDQMTVTADKRARGQWTRAPIVVSVSVSEAGSDITVRSEAVAQSLVSAASKPSDRMVTRFLEALDQIPLAPEPPPPPPPPPPSAESPGPSAADRVEQLERLHQLFKGGALTQEEFDAEKAKLLSSP